MDTRSMYVQGTAINMEVLVSPKTLVGLLFQQTAECCFPEDTNCDLTDVGKSVLTHLLYNSM